MGQRENLVFSIWTRLTVSDFVAPLKKALASPIEDIGIQPLSFPLRLRLWQRTTWAAVVLGTTSLV